MWCFARFDLFTWCFDICHDVYLTPFKCVCDIFQIGKLIFIMPFAPFRFSCFLIFWYIYRASFYRLFTEHRTTLETSSPPATSFHQDEPLTHAVFVLETLNYFLLLAYVSLGASNFVIVIFCLPYIFA